VTPVELFAPAKAARHVLIVAGGSGSRMRSETPKQFLELCGLPVLMHTIRIFARYDAVMPVTVVLPADQVSFWQQLCEKYRFTIPHQTVTGGKTRFHSVKNGLETIQDNGWIAVHDGVRPLVSHALIDACFSEAEQFGNAVPVIPVTDTVRILSDNGSRPIDRQRLRLIQTPQVFHVTALKDAYRQDYTPAFTDDASVLEHKGHAIHLTEGNDENIKITAPHDLKTAEAIIRLLQKENDYFQKFR
jgi:2-C-methyl-D-erythritol 4-phosphate cytidylyltransferase